MRFRIGKLGKSKEMSPEGVPIGTELWSADVPPPWDYFWKLKENNMTIVEDLTDQAIEADRHLNEDKNETEEVIQTPEITGTPDEKSAA